MSKFKIGDVVRLKDSAEYWSDVLYGKHIIVSNTGTICEKSPLTSAQCVAEYPDDFELVEDVSKRHVHHDMIVEWAKDPSRIVEYWGNTSEWIVTAAPLWDANTAYRFKPIEPERVFPKTSLGIRELASYVISEHETVCIDSLVAVANAAIKQYILEQENILDMEKQ